MPEDENEIEVEGLQPLYISEGEIYIPDEEKFLAQFPFLAAMNKDGQLFLLTAESGGKFVAIDWKKPSPRKIKSVEST